MKIPFSLSRDIQSKTKTLAVINIIFFWENLQGIQKNVILDYKFSAVV